MSQGVEFEAFFAIALDFDWFLWENGVSTTCEQYPKQVPIWFRPCPYDLTQREPVGCLCCTDLQQGIQQFHMDMLSWARSRLMERKGEAAFATLEDEFVPPTLAPRPNWMAPYRAH